VDWKRIGIVGFILIVFLVGFVLVSFENNVVGEAFKNTLKNINIKKTTIIKKTVGIEKPKIIIPPPITIKDYSLSKLDWSRIQKIDSSYFNLISRGMIDQKISGQLLNSINGLRLRLNFCTNGVIDPITRETDIDCGGNCAPCGADQFCINNSDCLSSICRDVGVERYDERGICSTPISDDADCQDFPGGIELLNGNVYYDTCDGNIFVDYTCLNLTRTQKVPNPYTQSRTECPTGKICRANACRNLRDTCDENDPSNNVHLLGIVHNGAGEEINRDRCIDERTIRQANCRQSDGYSSNSITSCPGGEVCSEGICVQERYCTEPNPEDVFTDATVFVSRGERDYRHIDMCTDSDTVQHIVCDGRSPTVSQTDCPVGLSCVRGLCGDHREQHCIELERGAITTNGESWWDGCSGDYSRLKMRADCIGEGIVALIPELCGSQEVCFNGACVQTSCTDSDGGSNTDIFGSTTYLLQSADGTTISGRFDDWCRNFIGSDEVVPERDEVVEQVCDEYDRPVSSLINCELGQRCSNGACVDGLSEETCTDSDNGNNILVVGSITSSRDYTNRDYCANNHIVAEYTCRERGYFTQNWQTCPPDHPWCDYGACTKGIDDDPDNNVWLRGTVTDINGNIHSDFCRDGKVVELSYNRETGEYTETPVDCPEGARCNPDLGTCEWIPNP